jgi:hypothetical protein
MRKRLEQHRANPACAACHGLMDPLGLALEDFDAVGAYRTTDRGLPLDLTGDLDGHAFDGPRALGKLLRGHADLTSCLPRQLYRWVAGQLEGEGQESALAALAGVYGAHGSARDLLTELLASDLVRTATPGN